MLSVSVGRPRAFAHENFPTPQANDCQLSPAHGEFGNAKCFAYKDIGNAPFLNAQPQTPWVPHSRESGTQGKPRAFVHEIFVEPTGCPWKDGQIRNKTKHKANIMGFWLTEARFDKNGPATLYVWAS